MRCSLLLSLIFFSLTSLAGTTLKFKSGDYEVEATLERNGTSWIGTVDAKTQGNGICTGTFNLDFSKSTLSINLDGPQSGCSFESMNVNVTAEQFQNLHQGREIEVSFVSRVFNNQPRLATVKIIGN